mmetsp:Transcript_94329/g.266361  ORF Transcript_94329/g.266361 Transcript_94329/m.266361 type:complete len:206 (-) Transcript_94329:1396-2013(-)
MRRSSPRAIVGVAPILMVRRTLVVADAVGRGPSGARMQDDFAVEEPPQHPRPVGPSFWRHPTHLQGGACREQHASRAFRFARRQPPTKCGADFGLQRQPERWAIFADVVASSDRPRFPTRHDGARRGTHCGRVAGRRCARFAAFRPRLRKDRSLCARHRRAWPHASSATARSRLGGRVVVDWQWHRCGVGGGRVHVGQGGRRRIG